MCVIIIIYFWICLKEEELGGLLGMKLFIEREEFKKLNVGFGLDEGMYVIFM